MIREFLGIRAGTLKTIDLSVGDSPTNQTLVVELCDNGGSIVSTNLGVPDVGIACELDKLLFSLRLADKGSVTRDSFATMPGGVAVGLPPQGEVQMVGVQSDCSTDDRFHFVEGINRSGGKFGLWFHETVSYGTIRAFNLLNHLPQCSGLGDVVVPALIGESGWPTGWVSVDCTCPT